MSIFPKKLIKGQDDFTTFHMKICNNSDENIEGKINYKIIMPDGNLVLYAQYSQGYYLTYNTNGGINNEYRDFGKIIKKPIFTQKDGYALAGWYADSALTIGVIFPLTLTTNKTIYAKWEEITNG